MNHSNSEKFTSKPLILSLLKAELKNTKLLHGLDAAGLNPEDFYLGVSTELLKLIGFSNAENDDELHDYYFQQLESRCHHELSEFLENINTLALELYNELLIERIRRAEINEMT